MAHDFGSLVFTPVVKALQEKYGSRRHYARMESGGAAPDRLGPDETSFLSERDSLYMATVGANGWPYVQHRGGAPGFLKVIDEKTLAFADYRGNRQYLSVGNVAADGRCALILVDYPRRARLKILAVAEVVRVPDRELARSVAMPEYKAVVERVFRLRLQAFDWNCPQHITPRFTAEQIKEALAPFERRLEELELENQKLREAGQSKSQQVK